MSVEWVWTRAAIFSTSRFHLWFPPRRPDEALTAGPLRDEVLAAPVDGRVGRRHAGRA